MPGGGAASLLPPPDVSGTDPKSNRTPRKRFGHPQKFLPVVFVWCIIFGLWYVYVRHHCIPIFQVAESRRRSVIELIIFHCLTVMLLICYVMSIMVHPGEIPSDDAQWDYMGEDASAFSRAPLSLQEMKKSGERRHCKWCGKYKPDRCHHCRVCQTCILKMDHHCPWIYNCVGFFNYKYFFLLLFYTVLDLHLIVWTMAESVIRCIDEPATPFLTMFLTFFGETLAGFLAIFVTIFFCFHIWLITKSMTTIEFCEKSLPKKETDNKKNYDASVYDLGFCANFRSILGPNMFLWLCPCSLPAGDGLNFVSDETRLTKDMESGKGIRRRTHQKTQRRSRQPAAAEEEYRSSYYEPRHSSASTDL
jgi:hypothetical protein